MDTLNPDNEEDESLLRGSHVHIAKTLELITNRAVVYTHRTCTLEAVSIVVAVSARERLYNHQLCVQVNMLVACELVEYPPDTWVSAQWHCSLCPVSVPQTSFVSAQVPHGSGNKATPKEFARRLDGSIGSV